MLERAAIIVAAIRLLRVVVLIAMPLPGLGMKESILEVTGVGGLVTSPLKATLDNRQPRAMSNAVSVDTTMEMPFMASLPKREKAAVMGAWEELEEFREMIKQNGAAIPVTFAGRVLNVSRQRVYELIGQGQIKTIELGGHVFVIADSLVEWGKGERRAGRPVGGINEADGDWKHAVKVGVGYAKDVLANRPKKSRK